VRASRQEDEHHRRGSSLRSEGLASHREQHDQCTSTIARLDGMSWGMECYAMRARVSGVWGLGLEL
jgi:hypothetical protein